MDETGLISGDFWEGGGLFEAGVGEVVVVEGFEGDGVLFRTSGTTGVAKGVLLGKEGLLVSARAVNGVLGVAGGACWGLALPLNHVGGFGILARVFAAGCGLAVFRGKWDAVSFGRWLEAEGVTHVSLVPTQVFDLVRAGVRGGVSLVAVVVGGGRLEAGLGQAARDLGWPVLASYGMTEAGSQVATMGLGDLNLPFVGGVMRLLPIWRAEVSGEGLLRLAGEVLFLGTVDERMVFSERVGEWFETRDRVELKGDVVFPLGRADSLVKVMGELVDLEAVERRLVELGGGSLRGGSFAVVAVADERRGYELVAVFEEGFEGVGDLLVAYGKQVSGVERVGRWVRVEVLPKTDLGKVRRGELVNLV